MYIPPPVRDGARRSTPCLHADGVGTEVSRCSLRASVVDANNTAGTLVCIAALCHPDDYQAASDSVDIAQEPL